MGKLAFGKRFIRWQSNINNSYYFILFLSLLTGFGSGMVAVIIKNLVHFIESSLQNWHLVKEVKFLYVLLPVAGISLVVIFIRYILRQEVGDGVPKVLHAISSNHANIKMHNLFSSIITSALTVGFGGSVGLEGPTVATGGAVGSNLGRFFRIPYRKKIILLGAACAGAMAAIFKAPIAGIVFAVEVIMIDLTSLSVVPILLASIAGYTTSFLFLGGNVLYRFELKDAFELNQVGYFVILGLITGFVALYFTSTYERIMKRFESMKSRLKRLVIGGGLLGIILFAFPSLYGEGYEYINASLKGDYSLVLKNNLFNLDPDSVIVLFSLFFCLLLLKTVVTSLTFGAGGIGGIFAPTLFTGANTGLFIALLASQLGFHISVSNSALVGMAGLIAGVLHAPLTGIFLIAEITNGYQLLFPLLITSSVSYITVRIFKQHNIYSIQLAKRKQLLTHNADKNALYLIDLKKIIEKNFVTIHPSSSLGDLVNAISKSTRNLFPVVDNDNHLIGVVNMNQIRQIMFNSYLYNKVFVKEIMEIPETTISLEDDPEVIAEKLLHSDNFNLPVIDQNGKYLGFISRANFFANYRKLLREFSAD